MRCGRFGRVGHVQFSVGHGTGRLEIQLRHLVVVGMAPFHVLMAAGSYPG